VDEQTPEILLMENTLIYMGARIFFGNLQGIHQATNLSFQKMNRIILLKI